MSKDQPPETNGPSSIFGVNIVWAVILGLASAATGTTRYGEGFHGLGKNGFFGLLVIILYATFVPCPNLYYYMFLFMACAAVKRLICAHRHYYGNRELSEYEGYPLVCLIGLPVGLAKQVIEPVMIYLVGCQIGHIDRSMGAFFVAGAFAAAIKQMAESGASMGREIARGDIEIQMRIDAERRRKKGRW
jgi:hypothetical protein